MTKLGELAHRRAWLVVIAAVVAALAAGAIGGGVAERLGPFDDDDPDTESIRTMERFERATGVEADPGVLALVTAPRGRIDSAAGRERVAEVVRELRREPTLGRVRSPFEAGASQTLIARDGRSALVTAHVRTSVDSEDASEAVTERLGDAPGVKLGGEALAREVANETVEEDLRTAELMAFPLLFLLSFVFFRSLVASALPLLVGGLSIVFTFFVIRLVSEGVEISVFALNLVTGLGLGLGIDYSLFMVSRYREEIARTGVGREALLRTVQTAGRTVLFSSLTVAAAMASLLVFPQRFLYSMGIGGTVVALVAAAVALIVLPAVLALLGDRVNSLAPQRLRRAADAEARAVEEGRWYRLSRFVQRRPARIALVSAVVLVAAGIPFLRAEFTTVGPETLPASSEPRQVFEQLDARFTPNQDQPVTLAAQTRDPAAVRELAERVRSIDGVAAVRPPQRLDANLWRIDAITRGGPLDESSEHVVETARGLPASFEFGVTGEAAEFIDLKESLAHHLPFALALLALTTVLVLFAMTGSVVLPIKALLMNVLTLSAAFGLLVLVFQDGRLEGLLEFDSPGALDASQPLVLFAMAFGLSTDYGVFLLSRIKEARDRGVPDSEAVAVGIQRTGRIVTAAAILFAVAIGAFATSRMIFIKEVGVGTAAAVLIDASIMRALLVPSLMQLLGRWNWWAPRPLRRFHDRFGLREAAGSPVSP